MFTLLILLLTVQLSRQFQVIKTKNVIIRKRDRTLCMNFFKEIIEKAFDNDPDLPSNKNKRQIDAPYDPVTPTRDLLIQKTVVQKRWLEQQDTTRNNAVIGKGGAPMNPTLLSNTSWKLDLYLTGIPDFDPSNSLYGSKVNISNRSRSDLARQGFAIGADVLSDEPTVTVHITLLQNGQCLVQPSSFTTGDTRGQWLLSPDGKYIRISMDVIGYKRTVTTKGTIQNIYWSDREESERKSSATYSIPSGLLYAEGPIQYGSKPGVFELAVVDKDGPIGILKLEKNAGLFGAGSKFLPCGKFSGQMIVNSDL